MAIGGARPALPLAPFSPGPGGGSDAITDFGRSDGPNGGILRSLGGLVQLWCGSNEPENVPGVNSEEYLSSRVSLYPVVSIPLPQFRVCNASVIYNSTLSSCSPKIVVSPPVFLSTLSFAKNDLDVCNLWVCTRLGVGRSALLPYRLFLPGLRGALLFFLFHWTVFIKNKQTGRDPVN